MRLATAMAMIFLLSGQICADSLHDRRVDIYVQALSMTKDYVKMRIVLASEIERTPASETQRLMKLAGYGMDNNLKEPAIAAYEKALPAAPGNMTVKRNLGFLLFATHDYSRALPLLEDYDRQTGGDYLSNFCHAEMLRVAKPREISLSRLYQIKTLSEAGDKETGLAAAAPFYRKALEEASFMGGGKDSETVKAQALFHLGRHAEAAKTFAELERKHPDDPLLITSYAGLLAGEQMLKEAVEHLKQLPEDLYEPGCLKRYKLDRRQTEEVISQTMLIRMEYQLSRRNFFAVREMLEELEANYPERPDVAIARSAYYSSFSNWRGELESLQQGMRGYMDDDLKNEERRLLREHGTHIQTNTGLRLSDNNSGELITENQGELRLIGGLRLGANYSLDMARLNKVSRKDGTQGDFHGTRGKSEIYLQEDFLNGDTAKISYYDQEGIPGAGGSYKLLDYWGDTRLQTAWRAPYWDQPQAVAEKGARSFMELERTLKLFKGLTISGRGSVNSYSLGNDSDLARSFALGARTEYILPRPAIQERLLGASSAFSINHEFDYEDFSRRKENPNGTKMYNPGDRHVQSLYLGFSDKLTDSLSGSLSGGFAYDFKANKLNPIYGITITYLVTPDLEISAYADQVISTNKYFYAGVKVRYSFGPVSMDDFMKKLPPVKM